MANRFEYSLSLSEIREHADFVGIADLQLRAIQPADAPDLAELMLDAYRGTIDYEGETLEDAVTEVQAYLAGKRGGPPLLMESRVAHVGDRLVGACLAAEWQEPRRPIISYVMTRAEWKRRGVGRQMVRVALEALGEQGYREVRTVITAGNTASERLFLGVGFKKTTGPQASG